MKRTLTLIAIVGLAFGLAACEPEKQTNPCENGCSVGNAKTEIGDGVWNVGDEIQPGVWTLDDSWTDTKKFPSCAWFVAPAKATPSSTTEPTSTRSLAETAGKVRITLHAGEHLTSSNCPKWKKVGS